MKRRLSVFISAVQVILFVSFFLNAITFQQERIRNSIENRIENKIKQILDFLIKSKDTIVIANVFLEGEKIPVVSEQEQEDYALPGVPIERKLTEINKVEPTSKEIEEIKIKNIILRIILPFKVKSETIDLIKNIAIEVAGINVERGDKLYIKNGPEFSIKMSDFFKFVNVKNIFYFGLFLIILFFTILIVFPFRKLLIALTKSYITKGVQLASQEIPTAISQAGRNFDKERFEGSRQGLFEKAQEQDIPFAFLKDVDSRMLAGIIETLDLPDKIVVINYIPDYKVAEVISFLDENTKVDILANLKGKKEFNKDLVEKVEEIVKNKIRFFMDGDRKLEDLLKNSSFDQQNKILELISSIDKEKYEQLSRKLINIKDIVELNSASLIKIYERAGVRSFASAMRLLDDNQKETILKKFVPHIRDLIKEQMELISRFSRKRLEPEIRNFFNVVYELYEEEEIIR